MPPIAIRRSMNIQMPKKSSAGSTQESSVVKKFSIAAALELDPVLLELGGETRVDPGGHEPARLVGVRHP